MRSVSLPFLCVVLLLVHAGSCAPNRDSSEESLEIAPERDSYIDDDDAQDIEWTSVANVTTNIPANDFGVTTIDDDFPRPNKTITFTSSSQVYEPIQPEAKRSANEDVTKYVNSPVYIQPNTQRSAEDETKKDLWDQGKNNSTVTTKSEGIKDKPSALLPLPSDYDTGDYNEQISDASTPIYYEGTPKVVNYGQMNEEFNTEQTVTSGPDYLEEMAKETEWVTNNCSQDWDSNDATAKSEIEEIWNSQDKNRPDETWNPEDFTRIHEVTDSAWTVREEITATTTDSSSSYWGGNHILPTRWSTVPAQTSGSIYDDYDATSQREDWKNEPTTPRSIIDLMTPKRDWRNEQFTRKPIHEVITHKDWRNELTTPEYIYPEEEDYESNPDVSTRKYWSDTEDLSEKVPEMSTPYITPKEDWRKGMTTPFNIYPEQNIDFASKPLVSTPKYWSDTDDYPDQVYPYNRHPQQATRLDEDDYESPTYESDDNNENDKNDTSSVEGSGDGFNRTVTPSTAEYPRTVGAAGRSGGLGLCLVTLVSWCLTSFGRVSS